ncbi:sensor histidine kinase [Psychrobacillus sp. FJAT-21963]|uniref:sensor histidine kinase n=1 Tax=Psychrobacillus sp. FJAT-21963 TaxID=1712028 RepID=UPI0012E2F450|nr:hypothetical protein [Psychrobacillus sp. FJAT-21963]
MTYEKLTEVVERLYNPVTVDHVNHIGLANTHKRLKVTYGEQYGLVIRSKAGWGTVIRIVTPK